MWVHENLKVLEADPDSGLVYLNLDVHLSQFTGDYFNKTGRQENYSLKLGEKDKVSFTINEGLPEELKACVTKLLEYAEDLFRRRKE
ncbi:hypothetical protein ES703_71892 [subsurface metagenome]